MAVARRDYPKRISAFDHQTKLKTRTVQSNGGEYVRFFKFYGCNLVMDNKQLIGSCPFPDCSKEDHFYANPGTGQWDCKVCLRSGNVHTFIKLLHEVLQVQTNESNFELLASSRVGIEWWVFQHFQLVWSDILDEWLIPGFSIERKVVNLYRWTTIADEKSETGYSHPVYSGPSLKQIPFGLQFLSKDRTKPLWICEGHWDTMAWYGLLYNVVGKSGKPLIEDHDVIGAPGAGTFPKEYLHLLDGRDVRVLYDNDNAGKEGVKRLVNLIANNNTITSKFGVIEWPSEFKQGFDIRDLISQP